MRAIHFKKIDWDLDIDDFDTNLPKNVILLVEDFELDVSLEGADLLSDNYGFCVNSFTFETMPILSLTDYGKIVGFKYKEPLTLVEIQEFLKDEVTLQDYSLDKIDYCIEEDIKVVLVNTDFGLRLCEII